MSTQATATFNPPLRGVTHASGKEVRVQVLAVRVDVGESLWLIVPGNGRAKWVVLDEVDIMLPPVAP